ncbi:hypothetical protein HDU92_002009 [Lobulomyces angularis]|nr:hypothetical protein HDU92_002009 [Lobulomyces angularis]
MKKISEPKEFTSEISFNSQIHSSLETEGFTEATTAQLADDNGINLVEVCAMDQKEAKKRNQMIKKILEKEKKKITQAEDEYIGVLVLGSSCSGKSTLVKQLRLSDSRGAFTLTEIDEHHIVIIENVYIICSRKATNVIKVTTLHLQTSNFKFIDVSGQKSQRHTWIPYFTSASATMFVVDISSYDKSTNESSELSNLNEALVLFQSIVNHSLLCKIELMLFFNKMDLLEEKLSTIPLVNYFPAYNGQNDIREIKIFFAKMFQKQSNRQLSFVYFTTSTDSRLMKRVINTAIGALIKSTLTSTGLM